MNKEYQYIKITHTNINNSQIKQAAISFVVEKKWITDNNEDKNNIVLLRYNNDKWQELETTYSYLDTNYYYKAKSSGLSYFAVGTKQKVLDEIEKMTR